MSVKVTINNVAISVLDVVVEHTDIYATAQMRVTNVDAVRQLHTELDVCVIWLDDAIVLRGICVNLLGDKLYVEARSVNYDRELAHMVHEHRHSRIFFQKPSQQSLVRAQIIADRVDHTLYYKERKIIDQLIYFELVPKPHRKVDEVKMELRIKHQSIYQTVVDLLDGIDRTNIGQALTGIDQQFGNYTITDVTQTSITAAWSVPVITETVLSVSARTGATINAANDMRLYLNLTERKEEEYDSNQQYTVGDFIYHQARLLHCVQDCTGAFNDACWQLYIWEMDFARSRYCMWLLKEAQSLMLDLLERESCTYVTTVHIPLEHALNVHKGDYITGKGFVQSIYLDLSKRQASCKISDTQRYIVANQTIESAEIDNPCTRADVELMNGQLKLHSRAKYCQTAARAVYDVQRKNIGEHDVR